jgi:hypothetical protein
VIGTNWVAEVPKGGYLHESLQYEDSAGFSRTISLWMISPHRRPPLGKGVRARWATAVTESGQLMTKLKIGSALERCCFARIN